MTLELPIEHIRCDVISAWQQGGCIVSAPPGSGKTTRLPLWLLEQSDDPIYLLIPKRLPVIMAAKQLASQLKESVGDRIGYTLRGDSKRSPRTQLMVITYGSFLRQLLHDPDSLAGATVILDEFHERSIEQDTCYTLINHYVENFDDSLKRVVMSATLNIQQIQQQLQLPLIESEGRSHPVDIHYQRTDLRYIDAITPIIERARQDNDDHILVFLPGIGEIRRVDRALNHSIARLILHSQLGDSPNLSTLELAPQTVILATNIAESSITIPRAHCVIDVGLERYSEAHPLTGLQELKTRRISQASANQRAGRAGRLGPGRCIRLWSADEQASLVSHQPPEITLANLTQTILQCAFWGASQRELEWLDPPNPNRWQAGLEQLQHWQAIDANQALTSHGKKMAKLGLEPWLAHLLSLATNQQHQIGLVYFTAHLIAAQPLTYDPFMGDSNPNLEKAVKKEVSLLAAKLQFQIPSQIPPVPQQLLITALADRVIRWQDIDRGQMISGTQVITRQAAKPKQWALLLNAMRKDRRFYCDQWLSVSEADVFAAIPPVQVTHFQAANTTKPFIKQIKIGQILLSEEPAKPTQAQKTSAWLTYIQQLGEDAFNWNDASLALRQRWKFIANHRTDWPRWPQQTDWSALAEPFLSQCRRLSDASMTDILIAALGYPCSTEINKHAPTSWLAPSGRNITINYDSENNKASVTLKTQEAFGLSRQPTVIGSVPITLMLTAPNGRPVANVTDVSYFWINVYPEVRKELRGRYAKHPWPEDPINAEATQKTNRQLRAEPRN